MEPSPLSPLMFIGIMNDLNELLKSAEVNSDGCQTDLDVYQQRTILRDGIITISKRCAEVIQLLEDEK